MSGSLSGLASAIGIPGASYIPAVFLGEVFLGDFAIPERIRLGTQQQFTVHKLPGGARVFDNMGSDPDPIEFNGIFLGPLAFLQIGQLVSVQAAAKPVTLAWGTYNFQVLIQHVQSEAGFNRCDWRVTLLVVPPPPPDNPDDDDEDLADGEPEDTPAAQQTQGQSRVTQARSVGTALPVPPIPPAGGAPPVAGISVGSGVHDRG